MKNISLKCIILILIIILTGCQSNSILIENTDYEINNEQEDSSDDKIDIIADNDNEFTVYKDKVIYTYNHDGTNITGLTVSIDYKDNNLANNIYNELHHDYEQDKSINSVKVDNNYLIIDYNEEYVKNEFGNTLLSVIKKVYQSLK